VIQPVQSHDTLLADIHASNCNDGSFRLWWLGQSGFLLQWNGIHVLLDPYLSDSLTSKYSQTDKPHVRMTELVIDPARLSFAEIATSTHNHTDHFDAGTLCPILARNPNLKLVIPEANRAFVADRLKIHPSKPIGMDDGSSVEICGMQFCGVASAHEAVDRDEHGRAKYLGYVLRFGGWSLYHSGDTVRYAGMAEKLQPFKIDVALLPINGRTPERRIPGNLFGHEAAQLAKDMEAKLVIPCHYEMFEFNTASPRKFVHECQRLVQPFKLLRCGEKWQSQSTSR
jgi:L-ascorbate metabolism protein UlaG (beta-lactamase superfamily)